ncbi:MAG TPA: hypothetical protein VEB86_12185 [Chryseosolibacter sp.]|nr:hypothetical protein [Chryseosolibacter sp.]
MKRFLLILVVCSSCATTPTVLLNKEADIQTLNIYFDTSEAQLPEAVDRLDLSLDNFITRFNAEPHSFQLVRAESPDGPSTLKVRVSATKLVTGGQQVAGVLVSIVGLAVVPTLMVNSGSDFYIFFYYFPHARSAAQLSLSPDLGLPGAPPARGMVASPAFLKSPGRQIEKHGKTFEKFMTTVVTKIERDLKKNKRGPR